MSTRTTDATDADSTDRTPTDRPATDPADRAAAGAPRLFDAASTARLPNLFDRENRAVVETKR
ncbi:hypothetical protein ACFQJD_13355 [Haloplanus sp. GCM10025708]|uniref:hypothetical protein n=1 Tax=Haloferacaceae TaxID=1644056 RepID=UPI00361053AA